MGFLRYSSKKSTGGKIDKFQLILHRLCLADFLSVWPGKLLIFQWHSLPFLWSENEISTKKGKVRTKWGKKRKKEIFPNFWLWLIFVAEDCIIESFATFENDTRESGWNENLKIFFFLFPPPTPTSNSFSFISHDFSFNFFFLVLLLERHQDSSRSSKWESKNDDISIYKIHSTMNWNELEGRWGRAMNEHWKHEKLSSKMRMSLKRWTSAEDGDESFNVEKLSTNR